MRYLQTGVNSTDDYLTHLHHEHKIGTKSELLRYDLGECPRCHKYFFGRITRSRKAPPPTWPSLPRRCWVWWTADATFYEGQAISVDCERPPTFVVKYKEGVVETQERELA